MSTALYQEALARDLARKVLPAMETLSVRDFRICENCGGPAMLHPKFEMAQIVAGEKQVLCCECLHEMVAEPVRRKHGQFRLGDQIWQCVICGTDRAWGLFEPWDRELEPALECGHCHAVTRHEFVRVA